MATYSVTHKQVVSNVAIVQLLEPHNFEVGQSITISGINATWNGTHKILALPEYYFIGVSQQGDYQYDTDTIITNQVQFALTTDNVDRAAASGTVSYTITCSWVTLAQLESYLGITFTNPSDDYDRANFAVNAANQFAYRRRQESGYFDSATISPGADITLGTLVYAATLYREAGSVDQFASFDPMATGAQIGGSFGQILRLLGVNRPQVA